MDEIIDAVKMQNAVTFSEMGLMRRRLMMALSMYVPKNLAEKQGCQIFIHTIYPNGDDISNAHKIYLLAIK
jgi:hypothetical protein